MNCLLKKFILKQLNKLLEDYKEDIGTAKNRVQRYAPSSGWSLRMASITFYARVATSDSSWSGYSFLHVLSVFVYARPRTGFLVLFCFTISRSQSNRN